MSKLKPNQYTLPSGELITERPILFQTDMVKAILEDRKTQTRRAFHQASYLTNYTQRFKGMGYIDGKVDQYAAAIGSENFSTLHKSKYGQPGDLLWVRESFYELVHIKHGLSEKYYYKADLECQGWKFKYKPSIHMPKSASRIWLIVEDIRVERVQEISEEDAKAEGIKRTWIHDNINYCRYKNYINNGDGSLLPKSSFKSLWISINGSYSWNQNPWVWVIKYRVLSKTGRPSLEQIADAYQNIVNPKSEISNRKEVSNV